jgi:hypothetical protein
MHDQGSCTPAEGEDRIEEDRLDFEVFQLLLGDAQRLWSVEEVAREVGVRLDTEDALTRLCGAGLVHRLEGFVFATRPALRSAQLGQ